MADFSDSVQQPVNAPPAGVNLGNTGDSMLSGGLKDFMDRMSGAHLGYLYNYWNSVLKDNNQGPHSTPMIGQGEEENSLLPELKTMNFGYMDGAAKRLDNLNQSGTALGNLAGGLSSSISGAWSDKAGQAASEKFGDLQKAANDYEDTVKKLATAMHSTWQTTHDAVDTLSKFASTDESKSGPVQGNGGPRFMGLYGTEDKWNVGQWSNNIDGVRGLLGTVNPDTQTQTQTSHADTTTRTGGSNYTWADLSQPGSPFPSSVHGDADNHHADEVIRIMNDFNNNYDAVARNFRAQIKATHDAVHNQMVTLQNTIKEQITSTDPFGKLSVGAPPAPPSNTQNGNGTGNGNGNGNYTSHGNGGGGGGGSTSTSAASFTPPPTSPSTVGHSGAGAGGGATTGSGAMPTIPPISTPVGSTGTGTSAYPGTGTGLPGTGTGLPGSGTGLPGSTPETLTVQSGGNTIGMSTPDSQNNVQMTVTDSTGHQHTYAIGFGQGTGTTGAPGSTPLQPGQQGMAIPAGATGPTGTDPSQLAIQHITPGADGHAVIHDGNMTITATEPQGHNGPVQVTVDDGSGHPSTYTLGGGQPAAGGLPTSTVGATGNTSASAWLSPDAVNQAQATTGVGGTVAGHVGNMSGLTGGGGGGGGMGGGHAGHAGLAVSGVGGGAGASAIHSVLGGSVDHTAGEVSGVGGVGIANTNVSHSGMAGGAGLAQGPAGATGQAGGSPMMGGMGGMGGGMGGSQGQDTERGASQWRTQGHLFDNVVDDNPASGFSGVLGEETGQQGR
jgi:hypothetical protein